MTLRTRLGELARQARSEAEHRAPTTAEQRAKRARFGKALIQAGSLAQTIGARLVASAHEDAEQAIEAEYDRGYEQRRADELETARLREQFDHEGPHPRPAAAVVDDRPRSTTAAAIEDQAAAADAEG